MLATLSWYLLGRLSPTMSLASLLCTDQQASGDGVVVRRWVPARAPGLARKEQGSAVNKDMSSARCFSWMTTSSSC
ncbi:hypothetical protein PVAP13_1KG480505 [Panicum virgatum]|uniref:Secreted protein n=1 Tax=Panicum virgatum TaxID=38727 RepID=A0A8T0XVF7_PANVG|nr:hypothetical protein PVAP13_1KG480505 [Panicum virgatum]